MPYTSIGSWRTRIIDYTSVHIEGRDREDRDSKCDFLKKAKKICLHGLILWNVFVKMTHAKCDKNALQSRRDRPLLNKFGSLTIVFSVLSFGQNLPMYSMFAAQYLQKY